MMIKIIFPFFCFLTSIYTVQFRTIDGVNKSFSSYAGKKILIVNIATNSPYISQLKQLENLHQQYGDSLIIVAFPSNQFGHEVRSNAEIKSFCDSAYNIHFTLSEKVSLRGDSIAPIYQWLTNSGENGVTSDSIKGDFQKFLISNDGELIGIFNSNVLPTDSLIRNVITKTY